MLLPEAVRAGLRFQRQDLRKQVRVRVRAQGSEVAEGGEERRVRRGLQLCRRGRFVVRVGDGVVNKR